MTLVLVRQLDRATPPRRAASRGSGRAWEEASDRISL